MNRAYTAVIFDLDGTLLDTLRDLADSMNATLADLGFPIHPVDAYRTFVGDGITNLVRRALPRGWEERQGKEQGFLERCTEAMRERYGRGWAHSTAPYPGIPELLDALGRGGITMAVLSNKPHELTLKVVYHFFGSSTFRAVLGAREGVPRKPDPAAVREILRSFGRAGERTLYVGDSSTDMDTARAAGLDSVGVLWGFRSKEELLEHGASRLARTPEDLRPLFLP